MAVSHVIFDMDGLLLDTETTYTIVQQQICAKYDRQFTWDLKAKMMGQKALAAADTLISDLQLHDVLTPEDFVAQREELLDVMFPDAQLLPGAERLLKHLHAHGVPMCLATSSHRRHFNLKTTNHGPLFSLFDHIVTGDMVTHGKPAPEIFLTALHQWAAPTPVADCVMVFEDAPSGVAAAKAAGMRCVMVPDAQLALSHQDGADEILTSLMDFDPVKYGLPPF